MSTSSGFNALNDTIVLFEKSSSPKLINVEVFLFNFREELQYKFLTKCFACYAI